PLAYRVLPSCISREPQHEGITGLVLGCGAPRAARDRGEAWNRAGAGRRAARLPREPVLFWLHAESRRLARLRNRESWIEAAVSGVWPPNSTTRRTEAPAVR